MNNNLTMNNNDQLRRDFEAAKRGVLPPIINRKIMRHEPPVSDRFNDEKTPLPDISAEQKD
jgi:hypothetical protein